MLSMRACADAIGLDSMTQYRAHDGLREQTVERASLYDQAGNDDAHIHAGLRVERFIRPVGLIRRRHGSAGWDESVAERSGPRMILISKRLDLFNNGA